MKEILHLFLKTQRTVALLSDSLHSLTSMFASIQHDYSIQKEIIKSEKIGY